MNTIKIKIKSTNGNDKKIRNKGLTVSDGGIESVGK